MEPLVMNHGVLSPNLGQEPTSPAVPKLDNNMESSFNLEGCISQLMQHQPIVSPPPTIKPVEATGTNLTWPARTSTTACFMGDYDIHPSHVKKKGLEGYREITISLPEEKKVSLEKECESILQVNSRVSSTDIANELTLLPDSCTKDDPVSLNVEAITPSANTIEGVGLVVDPQMTNLPEALKKVDKVIIVCDQSNLNAMFSTSVPAAPLQEQPILIHPQNIGHQLVSTMNGQVLMTPGSANAPEIEVLEESCLQTPVESLVLTSMKTEAAMAVGQECPAPSAVGQCPAPLAVVQCPAPSARLAQPSVQNMDTVVNNQVFVQQGQSVLVEDALKVKEKPLITDQGLETVDLMDVLGIKEEPAEIFTAKQLKRIINQPDGKNLLPSQVEVPDNSSSTGRPQLHIPMPTTQMTTQFSTLNTPDLLGDDGSFDLLEYITKEENIVEQIPTSEQSTSYPFQFPVVEKSKPLLVPNPRKRRSVLKEEGATKKSKIQVTVSCAERKPVKSYQKPPTKPTKKRVATLEKLDETRIKNNIASKRSRDNRKMKQLENEKFLLELTERNQELQKKHASLENLVSTMQSLLFNCMAQR